MWFWLWWLLSLWLNVDSFDSDFWSFLCSWFFLFFPYLLGGYLVERITIMKKVFKPKFYRIVLNGFYGIFAGVLVTVIVGYISNNVVYAFIGGILAIILYVWWLIINRFITIEVDSTHLIVKKGKEERYFEIAQCAFHAKIITRSWDTECWLYVADTEGKEHFIDCELIGIEQFWELLECLGIGDNQPSPLLPSQKI